MFDRQGVMHMLRLILLCCLMVLVLPWGADSATFGAKAGNGAFEDASARGGEGCAPAQAIACKEVGDAGMIAPPPRRCRGPALPGSPCGPDHVLIPKGPAFMAQGARSILLQDPALRLAGLVLPVALAPPRSC